MNILETPPDFPGTEDVEKGDKKKFLVEVECTGKEDDGAMEWKALSIDGVKLEDSQEEESEDDNQGDEGVSEDYDTSQDEPEGPQSTSEVAAKIMRG